MFPYHRLNEILTYIYMHTDPVSLEELVSYFHVSERTMRSDIQNINAVLVNHGAIIDRMRKKGYFLSINTTEKFDKFMLHIQDSIKSEDLDNASKRIQYILQVLLFRKTYMTQEELADLVFVSRNTIANYLKTIKIMIYEYHLTLDAKVNVGVCIQGSEEARRACFMELIIPHDIKSMIGGFTKEEVRIFKGVNLYEIERIVLQYAKQYHVRFSDFNLRNLILHFALLIIRLRSSCPLPDCNITFDQEYDLQPLIKHIEDKFNVKISKGEMQYLYSHFMSNAKTMYKFEENKRYLKQLIDTLLNKIYTNYHFDLRHDTLLYDDLTHHFQSILNTKRYHLNKRNPLLNTIKSNYPLAYDITLTSLNEVLQHEPFQLTDDEIGYVSLHIGAAIERCFNAVINKKSVIIVCGSGYATSRMLEAKLNNIFKDKLIVTGRYSYHEYQEMNLCNIDFVISTIPIEEKDIPVVTVDFSLFNDDIEKITKLVTQKDQSNTCDIDKFFEETLFCHIHQPLQKDELLHRMCTLLEQQSYVYDSYEQSVLKRESVAATNMDDILAIPHPMDLLATQTKVCVAILDEPIQWNEKASVQIILLLAINKEDQQHIEHLYDTFIKIMNLQPMQQQLLHCQTYLEFMDILHRFDTVDA